MTPIKTLGVVIFKDTAESREVKERLLLWANSREISLCAYPDTPLKLKSGFNTVSSNDNFIETVQGVVTIGGDGTFLTGAHAVKFTDIPVIGINLGQVGFLADIEAHDLESAFDRIIAGDFGSIERMVLEVQLFRNGRELRRYHALNDTYINRTAPRLISVSLWYGDEYVTDYVADGLIVATPSGSTAYSLAAGGPIITPGLDALLITPICPHSISERPLVLAANRRVKLLVNEKSSSLILSVDGLHTIALKAGDEIVIAYRGHRTNLIQFSQRTFFDTLRTKLHWSSTTRGQEERC